MRSTIQVDLQGYSKTTSVFSSKVVLPFESFEKQIISQRTLDILYVDQTECIVNSYILFISRYLWSYA